MAHAPKYLRVQSSTAPAAAGTPSPPLGPNHKPASAASPCRRPSPALLTPTPDAEPRQYRGHSQTCTPAPGPPAPPHSPEESADPLKEARWCGPHFPSAYTHNSYRRTAAGTPAGNYSESIPRPRESAPTPPKKPSSQAETASCTSPQPSYASDLRPETTAPGCESMRRSIARS